MKLRSSPFELGGVGGDDLVTTYTCTAPLTINNNQHAFPLSPHFYFIIVAGIRRSRQKHLPSLFNPDFAHSHLI